MDPRFEPPGDLTEEEAAVPYRPSEQQLTGARAAVRDHDTELLAVDGIEGVAAGQDKSGGDAIVVYVRQESVAERVPKTIEGFPVEVVVSGPITAY
jgi:hypothetical protein